MNQISVDRDKKQIINERRRFTAEYLLLCPFTNEPLVAVGRILKLPLHIHTKQYYESQNSYVERGEYFAITNALYGTLCTQLKNEERINLYYYFGKKLNILLKDAYDELISPDPIYRDSTEKTSFENFCKSVLDGKHEKVKVGYELIKGVDPIIASQF